MAVTHSLRLVLGDQLNHAHPWFHTPDAGVRYLLMETRSETDYARHHVQKVVAFFAAMRAFADHLRASGHEVLYLTLDDPANRQAFTANVQEQILRIAEAQGAPPSAFEWQEPDEYRLDMELNALAEQLQQQYPGMACTRTSSHHFLTERNELAAFFAGKKTYVMESFYRHLRKRHQVLMLGTEPLTGRWNYDAENRQGFSAKIQVPAPRLFSRNVQAITDMLVHQGVETIGIIDPAHFIWPVTRQEGLALLNDFIARMLPDFGHYQDAMSTRHWSLFHSRISFALNVKLLHPMEVIQAAAAQVHAADPLHPPVGKPDLAQVEGFVRQILGWREYMRGVYWAQMPGYATLNFFGHSRPLPSWFWTGETRMNCLQHAIGQSLEYAYAHHIQRLMVTGNFVLLAGIDPSEVDQWYLGIYIDAIEWVEITNTRGMSQYADGGLVGTKPYVSSAGYHHKMGDACKTCAYDPKKRHGPGACPFNSLYWNFYDRHQDKLRSNPRIGYVYPTWDKTAPDEKAALLAQAAQYLENIEKL